MRRRHLLPVALAVFGTAHAQPAFPDRPLRMVAPFAPGGASDLIARMVAEELGGELGQPVAVENRTGAGGAVGTEAVVRARPDGLTLLLGSQATHATNPALNKLSFDPTADMAAVAPVCGVPAVLIVHPAVAADSVAAFVALARREPGSIAYGSAGVGSSTHLAGALLGHLAKIDMQHIPYRGTALAMQDLIAGRIQMMMDTLPTALPHIEAGRVRALGVSTTTRSPSLPVAPTLAEAGIDGYEALNWYAVFAPAATPEPVLARLEAATATVVGKPRFQDRLAQQGMLPFGGDRAALARYATADRQRWTDLVRAAGITSAN